MSAGRSSSRRPDAVRALRRSLNIAKSTVEKYMVRPRRAPSPTWKTFLENHVQDIAAIDFFFVPTIRFTVNTAKYGGLQRGAQHLLLENYVLCGDEPSLVNVVHRQGGQERDQLEQDLLDLAYGVTQMQFLRPAGKVVQQGVN